MRDLVPLHWFGFGYTALVVSGGIVGYVKTGRVPSLAAGLLFGSLAGLGSKERLAFPSCYICYFCWCYGIEILLLWKSHVCRFNCRCQFADGRQSWSSYVDDI
uniref:Transmembrane protein 14C n=1 Tax=Rhinopithecus bieti TaxID=61621 RepID=A0A2K6LKH2_RHIBE